MKKFIIAIALLLASSAQANSIADWLAVHGIEAEAGIGQSTTGMPPNGIYWQRHDDGRGPYVFDLKSPSYYLGITGRATPWLRWRAGYQYLGKFSSSALAVQDERFTGSGCVPEGCGPWRHYITEASYRGVLLSLAPETRMGEYKLFVEVGVFVYTPKLDVITLRDDQTPVEVGYYHYKSGWMASPMVGAGAEHTRTGTQLAFGLQQINIVNAERNDDVVLNSENIVATVMLRQRF